MFFPKSFKGVLRRIEGFSSSLRVFERRLNVCQGCNNGVKGCSRKFQKSFKDVPKMFQKRFKGILRKFNGYSKQN